MLYIKTKHLNINTYLLSTRPWASARGEGGECPPSWNLSLAPSALALIVPKSLKRPKIAKFSIVCRRREKLTISSSPCVQRPLFCLKSRNFTKSFVFSLSCKKVVFGWKSCPSLENSLVPPMHTTQHGSTCRQSSRRNHSQSVWALSSRNPIFDLWQVNSLLPCFNIMWIDNGGACMPIVNSKRFLHCR